MMGKVVSTKIGVVQNALPLDFSFTELDTLRCCDCTTSEQQFSETDHDATFT